MRRDLPNPFTVHLHDTPAQELFTIEVHYDCCTKPAFLEDSYLSKHIITRRDRRS